MPPSTSRSQLPGPGWLFLAAGLVMTIAAILIPTLQNLREVLDQEATLLREVEHAEGRLLVHRTFLADLEQGDPALMRRLVTAQFNVIDAATTPILIGPTHGSSIDAWLAEAADDLKPRSSSPAAASRDESWLERMALGPWRTWVLAAGILCLFVGLITDCRLARPTSLLCSDPNDDVLLRSSKRARRRGLAALLTPVENRPVG